jgi:glycyl-tRNA synthetase beta chain
MPDFLLEIGCEEIPARMIAGAAEQLHDRVQKLLERERLSPSGDIAHFDTPRRLAVLVAGIPAVQPDVTEQITGPSAQIAFKDGQPTPAAQAFAKKSGVAVSELQTVHSAKGEYVSATVSRKGRQAGAVLAEALPKEINSLSWPKNMYWRKRGELFVRPIRWLVAMLDGQPISLEFDGVVAGNRSRGHRILANREVEIPQAGRPYVEALREAKVLSREDREQQILQQLNTVTSTLTGARWRVDKQLFDTVVNLTEFAAVILGHFESEFLELPGEVLVTVMRDHQKYFALEDNGGALLPHFLAVLNTDGDPQGLIQHGHERVLRARFNDARFFWETDQKHPLRERTEWLKNVTFQKDLGSYQAKTLRVQRLCSWLCEIIRQGGTPVRPGVVHKAACLAKADLTTELVKEFTELQGIVGGLYARTQELDAGMPESTQQAIADAIYDHYRPASMEDSVPRSVEGAVLSIGDKADSIAGMFALGLQPTGSKDPFALRRQANGIVKILAEHNLPVLLSQILDDAREAYRGSAAEKNFKAGFDYSGAVRGFFRERLEFYLRDVCGFAYDVVGAVLAAGWDNVVDAVARAKAVTKVRDSKDFESISVAFKRIKNILRQADQTGKHTDLAVRAELLLEESERELDSKIPQTAQLVEALRAAGNYEGALAEISALRPVVDRFFDQVMVMTDDERLRSNRIALLEKLLREFSTIADFSEIVIEGK